MEKITICRKWNNPQINIKLTDDEISMEMSLEDFLVALTDEVAEPLVRDIAENAGNPLFWATKQALTDNLVKAIESKNAVKLFVEAANRVTEAVKLETSKVM